MLCFMIECISDYQVDEPVAAAATTTTTTTTVESSTLVIEEENGTDMEMISSQLNNPMITTWSKHTQCTNTDRRTYVTSITLPAIQKQKKAEPPIPKYYLYHSIVVVGMFSCCVLVQNLFGDLV